MIMYVSKAFDGNIGATMHYESLKEIFGLNNIFTIDLRAIKNKKNINPQYIAFGKYKNKFERIRRWMQGNTMFISKKIIVTICSIIKENNIEKVFIEDSVFGNLVKEIKLRFPKVKVYSFYHDIKADLFKQWNKKGNFISKIENSVGIKQEKINQKYSDFNIVFNQRDAELFFKIYGKFPEEILALSTKVPEIEDYYKTIVTNNEDKKSLLFVGKNYFPNIIGLNWFYKNVLPKLNQNVQINIVGRGLEFLREKLIDKRINVIGGVEDLAYYYKEADIVIAPLFDGGGMKSKTIEALSFGKKFIGTDESLIGVWDEVPTDLKNRNIYKCNNDEEWISTINSLLNESIEKFNYEIFQIFLEKFSYDKTCKCLKKIMTD